MSKSSNDDEEDDIYCDLPDFQYDDTLKKLETSKKELEEQVATLQKQLEKLYEENKKLNEVNQNLAENISSLYKTANNELKRKDRLIQELRDENDKLIFRKKRFHSKQEYSVTSKDIGSEEKIHNSVILGTSVSANKCQYEEEVGNEICKELLVSNQNVPQKSIPLNSEQTSKTLLFQTNTNNGLKSSECNLNFDVKSYESFPSSNEQKELNRDSKISIKLKKSVMNQSESPKLYSSRLERLSPKPEYLEKHKAYRIKEMSSKYSSRSSSVKMANTVKSKYSKSRSSRSKTPFDKTDYRSSKVSRDRSPHTRDSERKPEISFMRSISRYSRSRSPPRRNKNYDTNNRYHHSHSKERKYNFKVHINSLEKFDSKHEISSKKLSSISKSKERETSKNSMPLRSRYEEKICKSSHSSKTNSILKNDYDSYKSKGNTVQLYTNDGPAEPKRNICKENFQKFEAEPKTIKSNILEHFPQTQEELKYSGLTDSKTLEVNDLSVNVTRSASNSSVDPTLQKIKEPTVIASNHTRSDTLDKTNNCVKYDEYKDIVVSNTSSRENLEMGEIKCHEKTYDENKSYTQSPMKESEHNTNFLKTSPTLQDPAMFKGGCISICMFNEQADFTRKRKRAKLVITNKSLSNVPVDPEIVSKVTAESRSIINGDNKSSRGKNKHSSINEIENLHSMECNSVHNNTSNKIEIDDIKISHNIDVQVNKISSNNHVNVSKKPKILTIKDVSHESRKNNELLNCHGEPNMILATNDKILTSENVIAKDGPVEKIKSSGEGKVLNDDNICSLSKILVSNKENINSTVTSKDKNTKLLIVKDKNTKDFFTDVALEEGELIDENSNEELGVGISNADEIPHTKDKEKIKERANQRRSSGNSRRSNSITRQTTRVKNAFGNSICERRSPSELFTSDKSLRKIKKKGDSHSKIIRPESQHPDEDNMLGNRPSEKRKTTGNETKLKQKDSKSENRNRQKPSHSHHLKTSEIDVENLTNENVPIIKKIQNVDKEHTDCTDIKIDLKKSDPREKLKESNQKTLKQQTSSIILNTNVLNSTASKENTCHNIEKRKIKTNKLCDMNQEKLSNIFSDSECSSNKSVHYLQNLISDEPIDNNVKDETAQHMVPEKQEITVSDNKYSTTAKIFDKVESITNTIQNFCPDISHDMVNSDTNANKTKSDIVVNNVIEKCSISGTSDDTGVYSKEGNNSSVKVHKRKNARMTRSKMNTLSTEDKSNKVFSDKLVSNSEIQHVNYVPNYSTVLNKVIETPSFVDCLNMEIDENAVNTSKFNSHSSITKTLNHNENKKQIDAEIPSQFSEPKIHQIGIEKLVTSPDTSQHIDIKDQRIAHLDPGINETCDDNLTSSIVTSQENIALHSLEQEDTKILSEIAIKSPLISPSLNTVHKNNEQIDYPRNQIMSNEELIKILVGSPPSAQKKSAISSDDKISTIGTNSIIEQNLNLKTVEPSQQSVKTKTIIMHRRSRVRMLQDSPIHTFTISSKLDHKIISNTSTPHIDRINEFIKQCDMIPQKKLEDPCALSKVTVRKDTAFDMHDREKYVNSDSKDKSAFTKHTTKDLASALSDVFGSDSSKDSSDDSDDSLYIPKKRRRVARGQTKNKKKIIKVKIKT